MASRFDAERWQARLEQLAAERGVPGASLAVLADGEIHTAVTGVRNMHTGGDIARDTLFQACSVAKTFTATAIMRLVERGKLGLDAPVREVLPTFRVGDPAVTRSVTARHLLTHTSGIAAEVFRDTGPGDDAVERFVESIAELGQDVPFGSVFSYCNAGFVILGRMIEQLTGKPFDDALAELVLEPAGLQHSVTRAEQLRKDRTADGHVGERGAVDIAQGLPRALGPAGTTLYTTPADLVAFARVFLEGGVAANGEHLLTADSVAEMLRPQLPVADRWTAGDHRGLSWCLFDWDGRRVVDHDGGSTGFKAGLRFVPDRGVAVALTCNGRNPFKEILFGELLDELCDVRPPARPEPRPDASPAAAASIAGRYERYGIRVDVALRDGVLYAVDQVVEPLVSEYPGLEGADEYELRPSSAGDHVYVARQEPDDPWEPVVLAEIDGERYLQWGARSQRRVA